MNLVSDKLSALPKERIDLLTLTIPSYGVSADPVDLFTPPNERGLTLLSADHSASLTLPAVWKFLPGDASERKEPPFDDSRWSDMPVPSQWENMGYPGLDSLAWYRVRFTVPADWPAGPSELLLGKIDDCDQTYWNGELIGKTGTFPPAYGSQWQSFRKYAVPEQLLLRGQENVVAVRVFDGGGGGGLYSSTQLALPSVWNLPIVKKFGKWNAVGLFNWSPEQRSLPLTPERLGLSPRKTYVAYDFWNGIYLGELDKTRSVTLPPTSCGLFSVHEASREPFVLSTSRHLTQGAVDLADVQWDAKKRTLSVSCDKLIPGEYTVILYIPPGMALSAVRAPLRHFETALAGGAIRIVFQGVRNDRLAWQALFQ